MKKITLSFLLCVLFNIKASATRYYVNVNANGASNGLNWTDAFKSLQSALSTVTNGDEIWVAKGTYKPNDYEGFTLPSGVKMYGGFEGNETTLNDRNWTTNITILDGNIGDTNVSTDNARHVIFMRNVNSTTLLDGFKVINGRSNNHSNDSKGGGLYNLNGSPSIINCEFSDNFSDDFGGGICSEGGNIKIANCIISNNTVEGIGAGIYFSQNGTAVITNSKINSNNSIYNSGGGIASGNGFDSIIIDRTEISGNSVSKFGGAITIGDDTSLKIYNSLFVGNTAANRTINMHTTFNMESHEIVNCTFSGNVSSENVTKSSIVVVNDNSVIANSIFWGNDSFDANIYRFNTLIDPLVSNCIIEGGHPSGSNNSDETPDFTNAYSYIFAPFTSESYDYSLKGNSKGIDAGDNSFISGAFMKDMAGNDRVYNSDRVDIGAYEFQGQSTLSTNDEQLLEVTSFYDPKTQTLNIRNEKLQSLSFKIYNVKGQLIHSAESKGNYATEFGSVNDGIYIMQIINKESQQKRTLKFVKY
jgi:hypothetical protein